MVRLQGIMDNRLVQISIGSAVASELTNIIDLMSKQDENTRLLIENQRLRARRFKLNRMHYATRVR